MAEDAVAYFKTWKVGSFLKGPPGITPTIETPVSYVGTSWGEISIPNAQGPGGRVEIEMPVVLWNEQSPYAWVDLVSFHRTRAQFASDVVAAAGSSWSNSLYNTAGWLVWIENDTTDVGGILTKVVEVSSPPDPEPGAGFIGYVVEVGATELANIETGEYLYLRRIDGTDHTHDVAEVYGFDRGATLKVYVRMPDTSPLVGADKYDAGDLAAQVAQAWPSAYLQESSDLPGTEPGANKVEPDVTVTFGTPNDAVPAP